VTVKTVLIVLSYYCLPLLLIVMTISNPNDENFVLLGERAELLLYFTLFIKPIAKIIKSTMLLKLIGYRRQFGVATFWLFLFHAGGQIYTRGLFRIAYYTDVNSNIFWGALAAIGMITLGITSNNISVKLLKKNWKKVQTIAYPTLFFVLVHISIAEGEPQKFILIGIVYALLKVLEWKRITLR